jgi:mRNA interferase MazF
MVTKNFDTWNTTKKAINDGVGKALFHEREVWWCALGVNIGFEQDGGIENFTRPVVIVRKFNLESCLIVPLTSRKKEGRFYIPVGMIDDRDAVAVVSQLRYVDRRRFEEKICTLDTAHFDTLVQAIVRENFSTSPP